MSIDVHPSSVVHPKAQLGEGVVIGPFCTVGPDVKLGARTKLSSHVVVDGGIDTEFVRTQFPDRYALKAQDGILNPEHIADNYWHLHQQPRDAWTFELDLRPYMETW